MQEDASSVADPNRDSPPLDPPSAPDPHDEENRELDTTTTRVVSSSSSPPLPPPPLASSLSSRSPSLRPDEKEKDTPLDSTQTQTTPMASHGTTLHSMLDDDAPPTGLDDIDAMRETSLSSPPLPRQQQQQQQQQQQEQQKQEQDMEVETATRSCPTRGDVESSRCCRVPSSSSSSSSSPADTSSVSTRRCWGGVVREDAPPRPGTGVSSLGSGVFTYRGHEMPEGRLGSMFGTKWDVNMIMMFACLVVFILAPLCMVVGGHWIVSSENRSSLERSGGIFLVCTGYPLLIVSSIILVLVTRFVRQKPKEE